MDDPITWVSGKKRPLSVSADLLMLVFKKICAATLLTAVIVSPLVLFSVKTNAERNSIKLDHFLYKSTDIEKLNNSLIGGWVTDIYCNTQHRDNDEEPPVLVCATNEADSGSFAVAASNDKKGSVKVINVNDLKRFDELVTAREVRNDYWLRVKIIKNKSLFDALVFNKRTQYKSSILSDKKNVLNIKQTEPMLSKVISAMVVPITVNKLKSQHDDNVASY